LGIAGIRQGLVGMGEFDWIQILALNILYDGQLESVCARDVGDNGWNCFASGLLTRSKSPLAHDEFESLTRASHNDGLQHAMQADGLRELVESSFVELAARLFRVWIN